MFVCLTLCLSCCLSVCLKFHQFYILSIDSIMPKSKCQFICTSVYLSRTIKYCPSACLLSVCICPYSLNSHRGFLSLCLYVVLSVRDNFLKQVICLTSSSLVWSSCNICIAIYFIRASIQLFFCRFVVLSVRVPICLTSLRLVWSCDICTVIYFVPSVH